MKTCPIMFKNVYTCFTEENLKCIGCKELWVREWGEFMRDVYEFFKKPEGSHNLCFTNYNIIPFWLNY